MSVIKLAILHVIKLVSLLVVEVAVLHVLVDVPRRVLVVAIQVVLALQKVTVTLVKENVLLHVQAVVKELALQDAQEVAILDVKAVVKVVAILDALAVVKVVAIQDATSHAKMVAKSLVNPHVRVLAVVDVQVVVEAAVVAAEVLVGQDNRDGVGSDEHFLVGEHAEALGGVDFTDDGVEAAEALFGYRVGGRGRGL